MHRSFSWFCHVPDTENTLTVAQYFTVLGLYLCCCRVMYNNLGIPSSTRNCLKKSQVIHCMIKTVSVSFHKLLKYHNGPKFLETQVGANSVDTDHTARSTWSSLFGVYTVCHSVCTFTCITVWQQHTVQSLGNLQHFFHVSDLSRLMTIPTT